MNGIKVTVGLACSLLLVLLLALVFVKNPEKGLYGKTLETLMIQEGLTSLQEVMAHFPILKEVKTNMQRIEHLQKSIQSHTGGPAPQLSRADRQHLQACRQEVQQLRTTIESTLRELLVQSAAKQP